MCSEKFFMKTSNEAYTLIMFLKLATEVLNHSDEHHIRLKGVFEMNVIFEFLNKVSIKGAIHYDQLKL